MKVYKMTNLANGKIYIGFTRGTLFKRLSLHYNSPRSAMFDYIREFGIDNFKIELLSNHYSETEAREEEKRQIEAHRSHDSSIGYNKMFGYKHSEETKKKIQKTSKKIERTPKQLEQIRKLGLLRKGTKVSDETRKKLSESHIGQVAWNTGKKLDQEHVEKVRKALTGKKLSEEHKEAIRQGHLKKRVNG